MSEDFLLAVYRGFSLTFSFAYLNFLQYTLCGDKNNERIYTAKKERERSPLVSTHSPGPLLRGAHRKPGHRGSCGSGGQMADKSWTKK